MTEKESGTLFPVSHEQPLVSQPPPEPNSTTNKWLAIRSPTFVSSDDAQLPPPENLVDGEKSTKPGSRPPVAPSSKTEANLQMDDQGVKPDEETNTTKAKLESQPGTTQSADDQKHTAESPNQGLQVTFQEQEKKIQNWKVRLENCDATSPVLQQLESLNPRDLGPSTIAVFESMVSQIEHLSSSSSSSGSTSLASSASHPPFVPSPPDLEVPAPLAQIEPPVETKTSPQEIPLESGGSIDHAPEWTVTNKS